MGLGIPRPQQKTSTHFLDCSSPLEREFFVFTRSLIFCTERIPAEKGKKTSAYCFIKELISRLQVTSQHPQREKRYVVPVLNDF